MIELVPRTLRARLFTAVVAAVLVVAALVIATSDDVGESAAAANGGGATSDATSMLPDGATTLLTADGRDRALRPADNLLDPGASSFEAGHVRNRWQGKGNTTIERSSALAARGRHSLRIIVDPGGRYPDDSRTARVGTVKGNGGAGWKEIPVDPGARLSGSVQATSTDLERQGRCEVRFYTADWAQLGTAPGPLRTVSPGDWTTLDCAGIAPEQAAYVVLRVFFDDVSYGEVFHVDDAWLVHRGGGTPRPTPEPSPEPSPAPSPTPEPTPAPSPEPSPAPTPTPTPNPEPSPEPGPEPSPTAEPGPEPSPDPTTAPPPPSSGDFPTPASTGPRIAHSEMTVHNGTFETSHDGQVVEGMDIRGNFRVLHDDVVLRDSRVMFVSTFGINVTPNNDGCTTGALFEYVEIDGRNADEADIPIHGNGCEWTLDHAHVHHVGRASKLVYNNTITNSYIIADRAGDSGAHRGAVGLNGGHDNKLVNNTLICNSSKGCSAALAMYGDVMPVEDILVEHNLFAANAAYCAYGGSSDSKPYPDASNVRFIDNHFSTMLHPDCGRAGPYTGVDKGVRGNVWEGNVWHETGEPID